jgi:ribosomal protein S18 acetylase RimI-like enzyme
VPTITAFVDADHRQQVVELWRTVFGYQDAHNEPALTLDKKRAVRDGLLFVALDDTPSNDAVARRVIGTAMGGYDGHRGWLYSIAVHPSAQRQGLGAALVRHTEQALAARGCLKINLQLLASNEATAAFYATLGYRVEPRVSMGKVLP